MVAEIQARAQQRDRLVSWIVIALTVLALLAGWGVQAAAEGRMATAEVEGLQLRYPAGWVRTSVEPPVLLRAEEWLGPARSALTVERRPLPEIQNPLRAVRQTITLERARTWMAYRTLESEESARVAGRAALRVAFAYVEANPNPYMETTPVVMYGEDYLIQVGNDVYVVTLTAAEGYYSQVRKVLPAVVRSLPQ